MIRNIVFDMGNVLIRWCPEVFVDRLGVPEEDRAPLLSEVFGRVEWVQLDCGTISFADAEAAMCRRLPERLHSAVHTLVFDWWKRPLLPIEGTAEVVRELKALGYGIYLLSNAKIDLPLYFDRIPGSEYRVLLREYGLNAEECFFVDDLAVNVEAAVQTGMSGTVFQGADSLRRALAQAGVPVRQL